MTPDKLDLESFEQALVVLDAGSSRQAAQILAVQLPP